MTRRALPDRRLLLLEFGTLLSALGNGITIVALPWLLLERTGSVSSVAVVAAANSLPLLAMTAITGALVDRFGAKTASVGSDLLSGLSMAAIALVDLTGVTTGTTTVVLVAVFAVVGCTFDQAGTTGRVVLLPAVAKAGGLDLARINGIHGAMSTMGGVLGPALAGVLLGTVGTGNTLWAAAGLSAMAALSMAVLRVAGQRRCAERLTSPRMLMRGFVVVWHNPLLRVLAILSFAFFATLMPITTIALPKYFQDADQPQAFGLVMFGLNAGLLFGSLLSGVVVRSTNRRLVFVVSLASANALVFALALLPPVAVLVGIAFVTGLVTGPITPILFHAVQRNTPQPLLGRVLSVFTSTVFIAGPLGYLVAGQLVEHAGVQAALLLAAAGLIPVSITALLARSLHSFDLPEPAPTAEKLSEERS